MARECGRDPETIRLVAVSKTKTPDMVMEAIEAGVDILGENYIQEARENYDELSSYPVSWHFIGHLQTNKAKYAVRIFDLIHSVDSLKLALELDKQAKKIGKIQDVLIQVNIGKESSKKGVEPDEVLKLVQDTAGLDNLTVKGLMAMPPYFDDPGKVRPFFANLRELRDKMKKDGLSDLSMGMTGDFETAIHEGSTFVRIGTAIFGKRN